MKIIAILFSAIPGIGHIIIGKYIRGIIFFFFFAFFINGVLLSYIYEGPQVEKDIIFRIGWACAALIWIYSMYNILKTLKQNIKEKKDG